jgi:hypothetical protein
MEKNQNNFVLDFKEGQINVQRQSFGEQRLEKYITLKIKN